MESRVSIVTLGVRDLDRAVRFYEAMGLDDAYRYTADVMVENMLARDAEEGIAAFVEKRPPKWEDR